ncbi:hypothetical protein D3C80_1454100 [compost metagenome]
MVRFGSLASSAAMAAPSIARKNQIAKGMAAKMPGIEPIVNSLAPDQPFSTKLLKLKPGATTPMNTSSSATASTVTTSSNVAAMLTPRIFRPMNTK